MEIEAFCWPSESPEKVKHALSELAGLEFKETKVEGQLKEKIVILKAETKNQPKIHKTIEALKPLKIDTISRMDDKGHLYIRLDKQKAYNGEIALGNDIRVKFKLVSYPFDLEKVKQQAKELFS